MKEEDSAQQKKNRRICSTCLFSSLYYKDDFQCRRYPPTAILSLKPDAEEFFVIWPLVDHDDFCGEWRLKRNEH